MTTEDAITRFEREYQAYHRISAERFQRLFFCGLLVL